MRESIIKRPKWQPVPWAAVARRVARPVQHAGVHAFRIACEAGDAAGLASRLDPSIAVVVDAGDPDRPMIRVVRGVDEAMTLLFHGMAAQRDLEITERSVNSQPGLVLRRCDDDIAVVSIDFVGRLISVVWIRLRPDLQRHGNHI